MTDKDCFVSVVAPLRNDAEIVKEFAEETTAILGKHYSNYEIVLVDDGSDDSKNQEIQNLLKVYKFIRVIRLSRSFGQEVAISAGLDSVIGDFVVVMLPDSDPPALLPKIIEQSRQGQGIVFGIRTNRKKDPVLLQIGTSLFYFYFNKVLKLNIPKNTTHFRVLSRRAVNAITQIEDRHRYLRTLSAYVGYKNQSFEYEPISRRKVPRVKGLWESINLAINMIVANSLQPLRMLSWLGFAISTLNIIYLFYVLLILIVNENVAEGWVTQSIQISGMFFFLFLILAILAEYVGRILGELKGRPLYYVSEELNSSIMDTDDEHKNVVTESAFKDRPL